MARRTGPTPDVVDAVIYRADFLCEVCGQGLGPARGIDYSLHHRRGRDGKPDSHQPQNLLLVHGGSNVDACHGRIHRNLGGESYRNNWLLPRNAKPTPDPLLVPVLLFRDRWVHFTASGEYADSPPMEAA